jgi:hypothetical protein
MKHEAIQLIFKCLVSPSQEAPRFVNYKDHLINAVCGNNRCVFYESYETYK